MMDAGNKNKGGHDDTIPKAGGEIPIFDARDDNERHNRVKIATEDHPNDERSSVPWYKFHNVKTAQGYVVVRLTKNSLS